MNELRAKAGISIKKGSDGKEVRMKLGQPIPKKPKTVGGKFNLPPNEKGSHQKLCQLCAVHLPGVKQTHNTAQCRKWNADGSAKNRAPSRNNYPKNTNTHQGEGMDEIQGAFAQMRKEIKSLHKLAKRKQKKRSKKRRYESSDDSDSDSK